MAYSPGLKLNEMAKDAHFIAKGKGFWDHKDFMLPDGTLVRDANPSIWSEKIALMHTELSEMLEAMRDGNEEALAEECADVIIRVLDFTDARGIDIDNAFWSKMDMNRNRKHLHGRKF